MTIFELVTLSLVQGLTEFLPISSSAHLILLPHFMGGVDQGLAFDVAVHMGTLIAVVLYYLRDLKAMNVGLLSFIRTQELNLNARLALAVLLGTIPVGIAGLVFHSAVETSLRQPLVIALTTCVFGLLLWHADRSMRSVRGLDTLNWRDVLVIGIAQAIAIIPGTSRSGITMTFALYRGLDRTTAARYSFLLSIPVIALASGFEIYQLLVHPHTILWSQLLFGCFISALSAYACIHYFLKTIEQFGLFPFVVYRLILGIVILCFMSP